MTRIRWADYILDQQRWSERLQVLAREARPARARYLSAKAAEAFLNARDVRNGAGPIMRAD